MRFTFGSLKAILFHLARMRRKIWFRALVYAVVGVATAFVAIVARDFIPRGIGSQIGADSVGNILSILAASMLSVATFSLSIMVTAFGNVSNSATPRASKLLMENQGAQRAVATFIGAFLYAIVGIVALATGLYGEEGRFVLFVVTIAVIVVIVVTLIRWVDHLAKLGRVGYTIDLIEEATRQALKESARTLLVAKPENFPPTPHAIDSPLIGYVCFVDFEALQKDAEKWDAHVELDVLPGSFSYPGRPLVRTSRVLSETEIHDLRARFIIEPSRSFSLDPRYGMILLSEIGSRALSPAVNDPGTAIAVMGAAVRSFAYWTECVRAEKRASYSRLGLPSLDLNDSIADVFGRIARDGAGLVEVALHLQQSLGSLLSLEASRYGEAVRIYSRFALDLNEQTLRSELEKQLVRDAARHVSR